MIIKGARVYTKNHIFEKKNILITDDRIAGLVADEELSRINDKNDDNDKADNNLKGFIKDEVIKAEGLIAIPGLVDMHFHGANGCDMCDGTIEAIRTLAQYEANEGVLAICPATMTYNERKLAEIVESARKYNLNGKNQNMSADLVGINMEGPFISELKAGAQNKEYIEKPDFNMFKRLYELSGGLIKSVSVAPEVDGASEFVERINSEYNGAVKVSIAHTNCGYDEAQVAANKGATHVTHLYNAMNGINHRNPGPIIAAYEKGMTVEIICDGVHIHPAMVRFTFDMFGDDKVVLISDSMRACGLKEGEYTLGGQKVYVKGDKATLEDGTIAGSVTSLYRCMKKAITEMGIEPYSAIRAASENPAKVLGISDDYGSIEAGKYANILLVDDRYNIKKIICKGKISE